MKFHIYGNRTWKVDKLTSRGKIAPARNNFAEVAEQADALRSGRSGIYSHVGSTPTFGTHNHKTDPATMDRFFLLENGAVIYLQVVFS